MEHSWKVPVLQGIAPVGNIVESGGKQGHFLFLFLPIWTGSEGGLLRASLVTAGDSLNEDYSSIHRNNNSSLFENKLCPLFCLLDLHPTFNSGAQDGTHYTPSSCFCPQQTIL